MKLIRPVIFNGKKYVEAEITDPSGGVIADTNKILDNNGNLFLALLTFVRGNIKELIADNGEEEDSKNIIQSITRNMTYKTIEYLAIKQILLYNDNDDRVEGIYKCPLCGNQVKCEKKDDEDNTDKINDLPVIYQEDGIDEFLIEFGDEYIIKDKKGKELEIIKSMSFCNPTIQMMIDAFNQYPDDKVRLHYKAYEKALTKVNENEINQDWKTKFAKIFFEGQKNKELNKISKKINSVGIQSEIEKTCNKCGKTFNVFLNSANFFVSTLQSQED